MFGQSRHACLSTKSTCIKDSVKLSPRDAGNFFELVFEWEAMAVGRIRTERFYQLGSVSLFLSEVRVRDTLIALGGQAASTL